MNYDESIRVNIPPPSLGGQNSKPDKKYDEVDQSIKLMIPIPAKAKVIFDLNCIRKFLSLKNTSVLKTGFGYKYYSTYKAQSLIGWSPKHTINDSLKETLADPISLPGN